MLCDRERDRRTAPTPRVTDPPRPRLRCAACEHPITDEDNRIAISGAHAHRFVNPGGFMYEIGCFNAAPGCVHLGSPETAFSWFPGWSWQIAACASCRAHLGWIYRNAGEQFHGLILAKLREA